MIAIIGYVGMFITLASIPSANSKGKFRKWYNWLIIVGGLGLTINAIGIKSIPFAVLNTVWTCLGIWGVVKEHKNKTNTQGQ